MRRSYALIASLLFPLLVVCGLAGPLHPGGIAAPLNYSFKVDGTTASVESTAKVSASQDDPRTKNDREVETTAVGAP